MCVLLCLGSLRGITEEKERGWHYRGEREGLALQRRRRGAGITEEKERGWHYRGDGEGLALQRRRRGAGITEEKERGLGKNRAICRQEK